MRTKRSRLRCARSIPQLKRTPRPAALIGASGREALRSAGAWSLLETTASQCWRTGLALERAIVGRVPVIGASLVLNHPRAGGAARGYVRAHHSWSAVAEAYDTIYGELKDTRRPPRAGS